MALSHVNEDQMWNGGRRVGHPLLKGEYTGHEKTYSGDVNISPRLAETKRNQQFLEKSVLPFFLGRSRFWLFHLFFLLNPGDPPSAPPLRVAAAWTRGGAGGESLEFSRKNRWNSQNRYLPGKIGKTDFSKKFWFRLVSASLGEISWSPKYVFSWPVYPPLRRGCRWIREGQWQMERKTNICAACQICFGNTQCKGFVYNQKEEHHHWRFRLFSHSLNPPPIEVWCLKVLQHTMKSKRYLHWIFIFISLWFYALTFLEQPLSHTALDGDWR